MCVLNIKTPIIAQLRVGQYVRKDQNGCQRGGSGDVKLYF